MSKRQMWVAGAIGSLCAIGVLMVGCSSDGGSDSLTKDAPITEASIASTPESDDPATAPVDTEPGPSGSSLSNQSAPVGDQGQETGPLGSTAVELESGVGDVQIGSGSIPELVPAKFPVPDDFVVQLSSGTATDAGFTGVTQLSFDEVVQFFVDGLEEAGYTTEEQQLVRGSIAVYSFVGPDGNGQIAISGAPGGAGRTVIVTYQR